jgi:4a-hydroxytetrahydrobiopterin dehydratase
MAEVLTGKDLLDAMQELPQWTAVTTPEGVSSIERSVAAPDFMTGVHLVTAVAEQAERANHHPDIDIRWRTVRFVLSSHDVGGVSARDLSLAQTIDALASRHDAQ